MRTTRCGLVLAILLALNGCAGLSSLAQTMNDRQIQSCIRWQGFAGGGWPGVPQVQVHGITATGGVKLETCVGGEGNNAIRYYGG